MKDVMEYLHCEMYTARRILRTSVIRSVRLVWRISQVCEYTQVQNKFCIYKDMEVG